jgi:hypothetical protein
VRGDTAPLKSPPPPLKFDANISSVRSGIEPERKTPARKVGLGGIPVVEVCAMHGPLLIVLTAFVLLIVSALALMNNFCKSSQHGWCAPTPVRHHVKAENSWVLLNRIVHN